MAGISHAVLIIEAEKKSGTMITARLATEYNRDVLTVPGSIFLGKAKDLIIFFLKAPVLLQLPTILLAHLIYSQQFRLKVKLKI